MMGPWYYGPSTSGGWQHPTEDNDGRQMGYNMGPGMSTDGGQMYNMMGFTDNNLTPIQDDIRPLDMSTMHGNTNFNTGMIPINPYLNPMDNVLPMENVYGTMDRPYDNNLYHTTNFQQMDGNLMPIYNSVRPMDNDLRHLDSNVYMPQNNMGAMDMRPMGTVNGPIDMRLLNSMPPAQSDFSSTETDSHLRLIENNMRLLGNNMQLMNSQLRPVDNQTRPMDNAVTPMNNNTFSMMDILGQSENSRSILLMDRNYTATEDMHLLNNNMHPVDTTVFPLFMQPTAHSAPAIDTDMLMMGDGIKPTIKAPSMDVNEQKIRRSSVAAGNVTRGKMARSAYIQKMMDAAKKPRDNPRDARNKAEKQRRDKLNGSINELATLVPLVAESSRKIDKTGVLRLTAHDLRKEHVFGNSMASCHMNMKPKLAEAFINMMGGCLITTTCRGIIIVISSNVEQYLGHCQTDLLGLNILNLCHPDDVERMKTNLMPHTTPMGPNGQFLINDVEPKQFTLNEKTRHFQVRLARAVQRSELPQYEVCRIHGSLRYADRASASGASTSQIVRRHRARGDEAISPSGNDVVFIGMIHIVKTTYLSERLIEASKQEYRTRHLIDGRIVQCDQRISVVAGYLTSEISGVSAFTFMHKEDVRFVIIALRQMYDRSKQYGESCYRLMSRTGEFIYLRTTGYLEVSSDNAVQSFVCMNTRIPEEQGRVLIEKMKEKYSVIFNGVDENFPYGSSGESTVEDPQKLEQVIMHLITNLPCAKKVQRDPRSGQSSSPTPTLSIIPPKPSTIKSSIAKSVSVISQAIKMKGSDDGSIVKPGFKPESLYTAQPIKTTRPTVVQKPNKMKPFSNCEKQIKSEQNQESSKILVMEDVLNNESSKVGVCSAIQTSVESANICLFPTDSDSKYTSSYSNNGGYVPNVLSNPPNIENLLQPQSSSVITDLNQQASTSTMPDLNNFVDSIYGINMYVPDTNTMMDTYPHKLETVNCDDLLLDNDIKPSVLGNTDSSNNLQVSLPEANEDFSISEPSTSYSSTPSALKRSRPEVNQFDSSSKRRMQSDVDNSQLTCTPDNIASTSGTLINSNAFQLPQGSDNHTERSMEMPHQGLDRYIQQLTDPNSNLDDIVPRSLAALETSIIQIDGRVNQLNSSHYQHLPQENVSEIIMEHQEHKQILESIQLDHRNRVGDGSSHQDSVNREKLSPTSCLDG